MSSIFLNCSWNFVWIAYTQPLKYCQCDHIVRKYCKYICGRYYSFNVNTSTSRSDDCNGIDQNIQFEFFSQILRLKTVTSVPLSRVYVIMELSIFFQKVFNCSGNKNENDPNLFLKAPAGEVIFFFFLLQHFPNNGTNMRKNVGKNPQ